MEILYVVRSLYKITYLCFIAQRLFSIEYSILSNILEYSRVFFFLGFEMMKLITFLGGKIFFSLFLFLLERLFSYLFDVVVCQEA